MIVEFKGFWCSRRVEYSGGWKVLGIRFFLIFTTVLRGGCFCFCCVKEEVEVEKG